MSSFKSLSNGSQVYPPRNIRLMTRAPSESELPRTEYHVGVGTDLSQNRFSSPSLLSPQLPTPRLRSPILSIKSNDILSPGDIVGEGIPLLAEPLCLVPKQSVDHAPIADYQGSDRKFEVVRKLGTSSYAIVYLVREILFHFPPFEDDHTYPAGHHPSREYGRKYTLKLLFKAPLDKEEFTAVLKKVTVHQAIPVHPNIVTLHCMLETSAFLLLLLEYVHGQDLYYFLEEARNHHEDDSGFGPTHTPPIPGLLSSIRPSQLLSRARLQLIASTFAQMCEAVAACHDASVFHRDIKPKNFIVTEAWAFNQYSIPDEPKVIVKLSDFGLSTHDAVSSEVDCGSAPYMSYECRNNLAPVYKPRGADVWSLGIVLINMIYHCNPWVDTVKDGFSSFDQYLSNPALFFMRRFTGMTLPVANFLVENVFCILDDPTDDSRRISALSTSHSLASAPAFHYPSVRPSRTHNTFTDAGLDYDYRDGLVLPSLDLVPEEGGVIGEWRLQPWPPARHHESDVARSSSPSDWANSNWRKYGVKGKGTTPSVNPIDEAFESLTIVFERLALELGNQIPPVRAPIQTSGSPAPGSHALDIGPSYRAPFDPVFVERFESLASASQALARSLTRSTAPKRTSQSKLASEKGSNVTTGITPSDSPNLSLSSGLARPTSVSHAITEWRPTRPLPKQRRKLSNYLRTHKDKFLVPLPVPDLTNSDDDTDVMNESEADNGEDKIFDVDSGTSNGLGSTKTMSKRSCSTGSDATRSVPSVDGGDTSWLYK